MVIVFSIADEMTVSVANKLCYPSLQDSSLQVLGTLLLYHQRCPQAFHKCIPQLVSPHAIFFLLLFERRTTCK